MNNSISDNLYLATWILSLNKNSNIISALNETKAERNQFNFLIGNWKGIKYRLSDGKILQNELNWSSKKMIGGLIIKDEICERTNCSSKKNTVHQFRAFSEDHNRWEIIRYLTEYDIIRQAEAHKTGMEIIEIDSISSPSGIILLKREFSQIANNSFEIRLDISENEGFDWLSGDIAYRFTRQ